jgi:hypothetical protein
VQLLKQRRTMHRAILPVTVSAVLTVTVALSPPAANAQGTRSLADLSGPTEFQKQFNEDRGHVRLVLLLSPT